MGLTILDERLAAQGRSIMEKRRNLRVIDVSYFFVEKFGVDMLLNGFFSEQ